MDIETTSQLSLFLVDTSGQHNRVYLQMERVTEVIASFIKTLQERTPGISLNQFAQLPAVRKIKLELHDLMQEIRNEQGQEINESEVLDEVSKRLEQAKRKKELTKSKKKENLFDDKLAKELKKSGFFLSQEGTFITNLSDLFTESDHDEPEKE